MSVATAQPIAPPVAPRPADPRREYVAGSTRAWYGPMVRALPVAADDLQRDLGDDIYERMMLDPAVVSVVEIIKTAITAHGWRLMPHPVTVPEAVDGADEAQQRQVDEATKRKALADEIAAFCQEVCEALSPSLDDVLWNMLDAVPMGNKVAELVYEPRVVRERQALVLKAMKVKPRRCVAFAVDAYMNVVGLLARLPGSAQPVTSGLVVVDPKAANVLPRSKFAVLTHHMRDGDPRGSAGLRPAYNPWWIKIQSWPEWLKFVAQFATPSVSAELGPDPEGYIWQATDPVTGEERLSPEEELTAELMKWQNGTAIAVSAGTKITVHDNGENTGEAFDKLFNRCDDYIKLALLLQLLATGTAEHQTNASSRTHQDVLDDVISSIKGSVARMFRADVLTWLVRYNFGEQAVALTPHLDLGAVEQQDLTPLMEAIALLARAGYIAKSQRRGIDMMLGLPLRTEVEGDEEPAAADEGADEPPADDSDDLAADGAPDDEEEADDASL